MDRRVGVRWGGVEPTEGIHLLDYAVLDSFEADRHLFLLLSGDSRGFRSTPRPRPVPSRVSLRSLSRVTGCVSKGWSFVDPSFDPFSSFF